MNTCDTCKWWDFENSNKHYKDCSFCLNPKMQGQGGKDAIALDEGGAILYGEKFGCVHHEPK